MASLPFTPEEPDDPLRGSVAVLVPAYEEADNLVPVVRAALEAQVGDVLVVDDGSSDATAEVARRAGARVLELPENRGKGGAIAAGAADGSAWLWEHPEGNTAYFHCDASAYAALLFLFFPGRKDKTGTEHVYHSGIIIKNVAHSAY